MSAYYPTQREIEEDYLLTGKSVNPSIILMNRRDLISIKRENFKYALVKTLPSFLRIFNVPSNRATPALS